MSHAVPNEWCNDLGDPKFLVENPTALNHSIRIINPEDPAHPIIIPLQLDGVLSYFPFWCPTAEEYEDDKIPQFELTAAGADWDSYDCPSPEDGIGHPSIS